MIFVKGEMVIVEESDARELPKNKRREMVNVHGDKMTVGKAYDLLEDTEMESDGTQLLIKIDRKSKVAIGDGAYAIMINGLDMSGSLATEEHMILNIMKVSDPYYPKVFVDRMVELANKGRFLRYWHPSKELGLPFIKDADGKFIPEALAGTKRSDFKAGTEVLVEGKNIIFS